MRTVCRLGIGLYALLYLSALALVAIGTFGLFGQPRDPLAGAYLMPLGLPWVLRLDGLPDGLAPWAAVLAPLVNIGLLLGPCLALSRGRPA